MEEWLEAAVQAEFIMGNLRGVPNICIDILMGVPKEVIEAEREALRRQQELAEVEEKAKAAKSGKGKKGPIDPKQRELFFQERERAQMEAMTKDLMGVPQEMIGEVDLSFPDTFIRSQQRGPEES